MFRGRQHTEVRHNKAGEKTTHKGDHQHNKPISQAIQLQILRSPMFGGRTNKRPGARQNEAGEKTNKTKIKPKQKVRTNQEINNKELKAYISDTAYKK